MEYVPETVYVIPETGLAGLFHIGSRGALYVKPKRRTVNV
jgi:hypothetical protein